jgi:hypothetical protein
MRGFTASLLLAGSAGIATGQEAARGEAATISVELNAIQPVDGGCALTFMVENGLPDDIEKLVTETVLINTNGRVDRLTLFDFGDVPSGRTRVRQFAVPQFECGTFGRLLVNGASTCLIGGTESEVCDSRLALTSRTRVEAMR